MGDPRVESLTQRLRNEAATLGVPVLRARQQRAFSCLLAPLAKDSAWTLKSGFALELRLGLRARATKDLDLVSAAPSIDSAESLQDALQDALEVPDLDDGFVFDVRRPRPHRAEDAIPSTLRGVVDSRMHGSRFQEIPLDIVIAAEPRAVDAVSIRDLLSDSVTTMGALPVAQHAGGEAPCDQPSLRVRPPVRTRQGSRGPGAAGRGGRAAHGGRACGPATRSRSETPPRRRPRFRTHHEHGPRRSRRSQRRHACRRGT